MVLQELSPSYLIVRLDPLALTARFFINKQVGSPTQVDSSMTSRGEVLILILDNIKWEKDEDYELHYYHFTLPITSSMESEAVEFTQIMP